MVAHVFNPSSWEAEIIRSLDSRLARAPSEILSQKPKQTILYGMRGLCQTAGQHRGALCESFLCVCQSQHGRWPWRPSFHRAGAAKPSRLQVRQARLISGCAGQVLALTGVLAEPSLMASDDGKLQAPLGGLIIG